MKKLTVILAALVLAGCATAPGGAQYEPLIDRSTNTAGNYQSDLQDCQAYATRVAGAGEGAAAGAVAGAIVMGALSAILGGTGHGRWAAAGALTGALSGAGSGEVNQRDVIRRCMAGRGYNVLN